ncbi:MAG: hypothetical protein NVS1B10_05860 [Candidatus Saccharimonadales bacterium]
MLAFFHSSELVALLGPCDPEVQCIGVVRLDGLADLDPCVVFVGRYTVQELVHLGEGQNPIPRGQFALYGLLRGTGGLSQACGPGPDLFRPEFTPVPVVYPTRRVDGRRSNHIALPVRFELDTVPKVRGQPVGCVVVE